MGRTRRSGCCLSLSTRAFRSVAITVAVALEMREAPTGDAKVMVTEPGSHERPYHPSLSPHVQQSICSFLRGQLQTDSLTHPKAICICLEGMNQSAGTHGEHHHATNYLLEQESLNTQLKVIQSSPGNYIPMEKLLK
jgi:hypothetical protein